MKEITIQYYPGEKYSEKELKDIEKRH